MSSRDEVDTVGAAALAAGGTEADDAEDHGFMYSRSFFDLDGHGWQVMWMDPAAAEQGPEAFAASTQDADRAAGVSDVIGLQSTGSPVKTTGECRDRSLNNETARSAVSEVPPEGIEPSTFGLRVRCSAN